MRIIQGLVWLSEVRLDAQYFPHFYIGDSADHGHAVIYKHAPK